MKDKNIAVDLDGVIFEYDKWKGLEHFGKPIEGVREALLEFQKMGFRIVIYTTRTNLRVNAGKTTPWLIVNVMKALNKYEIPFDSISTSKPLAEFYIDDRAIRFKNWKKTVKKIKYLGLLNSL